MCKVFLDYFHLVQAGAVKDDCLVSWWDIEDFTSQLVNRNHNKRCLRHDKIPMEFDLHGCKSLKLNVWI